jgi:site-specific recombinase XerC
MSLVDAAGRLDQRPAPSDELRRRIVGMRATGRSWKAIAAELDIAESTAIYHAKRATDRPMPRYRAVVATLTLAGLRVSELCALNCEHVDLARRELGVLDAKTQRECAASTSTTISRKSSPRTRPRAVLHGGRVSRRF